MPFTYDLSPTIVSIGPFALRWYALVYVAGFLVAYWLLRRAARRGEIAHLTEDGVEDYTSWLIGGSIVAARLFYALVYNPAYYWASPWKVVAVWEGGLSFHGGFLGAILVTWWWTRRQKVRFFALADLLVVPLSLALAFGRVANFVNGELVGRVTDVAWCVTYPWLEGCRHPSQFYEAAQNLLMFAVLLPVYLKGTLARKLKEGAVFWLFVLLYGVGRFVVNFWRAPDPTDPLFLGLLIGQWLSLAMALVAIAMLVRDGSKRRESQASARKIITTNK